jgi:hypothetical protein
MIKVLFYFLDKIHFYVNDIKIKILKFIKLLLVYIVMK